MLPQVTFFTNCWEGDWRYLLKTPRLQNAIENHNFPFAQKILCISNVKDESLVKKHADKLVSKGVITSYFLANEFEGATLEFFDLTKEELKQSYYYTLAPLVELYLCKTDYLVHQTGDVILYEKADWITPSLIGLGVSGRNVVANPVWDRQFAGAKSESFSENENFFIGFGFSDQCYLVKRDVFRRPIYKEWNDASSRYPTYVMWGFERRVDSWMRNNNLHRLTYKTASYRHESFSKNPWKQRMELLLGTRNKK